MHPAQLPVDELLKQCEVTRTRRSGPGGQHRNKVETAVVVTHLPTGIRGEASERRSQQQNREQAVFRLRVRLAVQHRTAPASEPSPCWRRRVTRRRIAISNTHDDFPALLAEVMNALAADEYSTSSSAENFGISTSQLIKFLKAEPSALASVNRERQHLGKRPLK